MLKENALDDKDFRYPSYMQDIMGWVTISDGNVVILIPMIPFRDIFSMGFGPFRWVCTSGSPDDLHATDLAAVSVIDKLLKDPNCRDLMHPFLDIIHPDILHIP